jgi:hypothetical protein
MWGIILKLMRQDNMILNNIINWFKNIHIFHSWKMIKKNQSFSGHCITTYICSNCGQVKEYLD